MSAAMGQPRMSAEQYFAWEAGQPGKHEFVAGEVFAMVGATRKHNLVAGNVYRHLASRLEGSPCRAFISDLKLEVAAASAFFYPDVLVTCSAQDLKADQVMTAPSVIIEVLSPSTGACDRGDKFAAYRLIASLQEYLLIDPETHRIDGFRREGERWIVIDRAGDEPVAFASLGVELSREDIFRDVE
jgi:Uma2 family endonuclease